MNPVIERLMEERKKWLQDIPNGFTANPFKNIDGTLNLLKWECKVPGPRQTPWEGKSYNFTIEFDKDDLNKPLEVFCTSKIFHPNVDHTGYVCSSLINFWPKLGLKQIIFSLQSFLEFPNIDSVLNFEAANLFKENRYQYNDRVKNTRGDVCVNTLETNVI